MCVIILAEKKLPSLENLKKCEKENPDGLGFSWFKKGKVFWEKGLFKIEEKWEKIQNITLPIVFHFRIGTVGGKTAPLCHPFPISENADLSLNGETPFGVLYHNGHWEDWKETCLRSLTAQGLQFPDGNWSDSRAIAWLCYYHSENILSLLEGQKFIFFSPQKIKIFGNFSPFEGCLYSNLNWNSPAASFPLAWPKKNWDNWEWEKGNKKT